MGRVALPACSLDLVDGIASWLVISRWTYEHIGPAVQADHLVEATLRLADCSAVTNAAVLDHLRRAGVGVAGFLAAPGHALMFGGDSASAAAAVAGAGGDIEQPRQRSVPAVTETNGHPYAFTEVVGISENLFNDKVTVAFADMLFFLGFDCRSVV